MGFIVNFLSFNMTEQNWMDYVGAPNLKFKETSYSYTPV